MEKKLERTEQMRTGEKGGGEKREDFRVKRRGLDM